MQVVDYKGDTYPHFQTIGNASQFAIPFAMHVCNGCLLYTSPSPRDKRQSRMPSSA